MNTVYPKIDRRVGTVNDETVDFESILTIYALWRSIVQSCEEVAKCLVRLPYIYVPICISEKLKIIANKHPLSEDAI